MIRTVRGDRSADGLGAFDSHDHLFLRSPQLPGQELTDPDAAEQQLRAFAALGGSAVVQWTPWGMGRRARELAALSRRTGVHLVAATGLHQARHYAHPPPGTPGAAPYGDLAALFVAELTDGIRDDARHGAVEDPPDGDAPRAGLIKIAGDFHHLDAHARTTLNAAADAHHATGAPVAVHLEGGTAALEVTELLCRERNVPPHRVLLGHLGRSGDRRMQRDAAATGAHLVFDGPSRAHHATDGSLLDTLESLAAAGHAGQLLLGADTTTAAARAVPGMAYLLSQLRPRIARELGGGLADLLFVHNPARAFTADWK